ncbi:tigger transposable element-derived protein 1-like [Octopus sinensis]|uniref:Tigger transposable element-derived protein 1-like n=1 Tax=Octopus sinensis TaxID=2607531 RepID=A0A6P7SQL4_9MOLL|nr:tigger transposable element-derived protein 1-like [Octopus sinensis]
MLTISQKNLSKESIVSEELKKKYPDEKDVEFKASQGWFMRFKEQRCYHSIKKQGEIASVDEQAAAKFPNALKKIIEENGFLLAKIFNGNKTGLYCKKLPDHSLISKEKKTIPGYKVSKEHPHYVGRWLIQKHGLLVLFSKIGSSIILSQQQLLILDNAPGHPQNIVNFDPNITVINLPPNTMSLLQPMDQGIIAIFKHYYMKCMLQQAIAATDLNESITLCDFWNRYIYKAVQNIAAAWNDIQSMAKNGVWKKLYPQFVNDFNGFDDVAINKMLVTISKELEMDLEEEDFRFICKRQAAPDERGFDRAS